MPAGELAPLLVETGVAERRDGLLRGLVRVVPHDDLLIASDRLDVEERTVSPACTACPRCSRT